MKKGYKRILCCVLAICLVLTAIPCRTLIVKAQPENVISFTSITGEQTSVEPSSEDQSSEEPGSEEQSSEEPGSEEQSSEEPGSEDQPSEEPGSEDQPSEEPGSEEQSSEEPGSEDQSSEEPSSEEQSSEEPSSEPQTIWVEETEEIPFVAPTLREASANPQVYVKTTTHGAVYETNEFHYDIVAAGVESLDVAMVGAAEDEVSLTVEKETSDNYEITAHCTVTYLKQDYDYDQKVDLKVSYKTMGIRHYFHTEIVQNPVGDEPEPSTGDDPEPSTGDEPQPSTGDEPQSAGEQQPQVFCNDPDLTQDPDGGNSDTHEDFYTDQQTGEQSFTILNEKSYFDSNLQAFHLDSSQDNPVGNDINIYLLFMEWTIAQSFSENTFIYEIVDDKYASDKLQITCPDGVSYYEEERDGKRVFVFQIESDIYFGSIKVDVKNVLGVNRTLILAEAPIIIVDCEDPVISVNHEATKTENPAYEEKYGVDADFYKEKDVKFSYTIRDDGKLKPEYVTVSGIEEEYVTVSQGLNKRELQVDIQLPDGIYPAATLTVVDSREDQEHPIEMPILTATKNFVDSVNPEITVQLTDENGDKYTGQRTNKNIAMKVDVVSPVSGLESVDMMFVPAGKQASECEWESILEQLDENGSLEMTFGQDVTEKNDRIAETVFDHVFDMESATHSIHDKTADEDIIVFHAKRGTYFFKSRSYATRTDESNDHKVDMLQRSVPSGNIYSDKTFDEKNGWFNVKTTKPDVLLSYVVDTELVSTKVSGLWDNDQADPNEISMHVEVHYEDSSLDNKHSNDTQTAFAIDLKKQGEVSWTDQSFIDKNGYYTITTWCEDIYGNRSVTSTYSLKMDLTPPYDLAIHVAGEDFTQENPERTYENFFQSQTEVKTMAQDDMPDCTPTRVLSSLTGSVVIGASESECVVEPGTRAQFKLTATDQAGNESVVYSKGFVVDNELPKGKDGAELTLIPKGANKYGFYNADFSVDMFVQDEPQNGAGAALRTVSYKIVSTKKTSDNILLLNENGEGKTDSQLNMNQEVGKTELIKVAEYEDNETYIELTAEDNAKNTVTTKVEVPIDITAPVINISFDNNTVANGRYYKNNRRARIEITEKNFDPSFVEFHITRNDFDDDSFIPDISSWKSEQDSHVAYIYFDKDGDYSLSVDCKDLADNEAKTAQVDDFTIDATPADITVTYDKQIEKNGYINEQVVATITVEEHSFDPSAFAVKSDQKLTLGKWQHNGDTHRATILFDRDGEYAYSFECTDLAGNVMDKMEEEKFTIDTVLPKITIAGVADQSANAGEINPSVMIEDAHMDFDQIVIRLTNGKGEVISLQQETSVTAISYFTKLTNASSQADSVYHLDVICKDKAGNESEQNYRYSLNRHGSTYDLSSAKAMVDQVYNQSSQVKDIQIVEMNVDPIEQFNIYVTKNGQMINGRQVNGRPVKVAGNEILYSVKTQGNESVGYQYTYTVYAENFAEEGSYNLTFTSQDKAGNRVNNTLEEKNAKISFVVDNTAPAVFIDGVDTGEIYSANELPIHVYVTDNFNLDSAEFYLVNQKGETVQTWNYLELTDEPGEVVTIVLPGSDDLQSLYYTAVDKAGNKLEALKGSKESVVSFLITTNSVAQLENIEETAVAKAEKYASNISPEVIAKKSVPIAVPVTASAAGIIMFGGFIVAMCKRIQKKKIKK